MTIKKRLFYSNLIMVVAPLLAFITASIIFGGILRAIFASDFIEIVGAEHIDDSRNTLINALADKTSMATVITFFALSITVAVFIVIIISLFLAGKMVKKIVLPLNNLCDGAQRISEGNFDEDIHCQDTEELKKVCEAFNEMQRQFKANIKKNEIYEQDRKENYRG